ncbi:MAG: lipase family protein [Hyphomicrobiales bacterium]
MEMFPDTVRISTPGGNGVRYFLEVSPQEQTQTIAVAGTRTFSDILHDIAFAIVPDNLLHAAFHEGFEAEARLVYADVRPHLNPDYQVRLTGHSLGAAVSAILMIYLQGDGYLIEPSINFGQPKFMNRASAELYSDLPLQRVVDANDIVPMLPPRFLLHPTHGAYAHVGEEIILLEGAYFVHLTSHDAERLSVDQFWRDRDFASREDHHMARYTERIAAKQVLAQEVDYMVWRSMAAN